MASGGPRSRQCGLRVDSMRVLCKGGAGVGGEVVPWFAAASSLAAESFMPYGPASCNSFLCHMTRHHET